MSPEPSLYERLGGADGIDSFVHAFYVNVLADPELSPFFRNTPLAKLHAMQREFFSMALGGPVTYTGKSLAHAHHGRGITAHHFGRFVSCLTRTLEALDVEQEDIDEVIHRINTYANEVTGTSY